MGAHRNNEPPPGFGKIKPSRVPFGDRLSGLCAIEMTAARGDGERVAEMIERLCNSLAFTIAIAGAGDAEAINNLLEGASGYLYEAATEHQKWGDLLESVKGRGRK